MAAKYNIYMHRDIEKQTLKDRKVKRKLKSYKLTWKNYTISRLHHKWPMSAHASHVFSTSNAPIV